MAAKTKPLPLLELPAADQYGNYWFDKPGKSPAIIKAGKPITDGGFAPRHAKGYFVSRESGVIFDGTYIRYFATVQFALEALREERHK